MLTGEALAQLPHLPLPQRDCLPDCPAVYFAVDADDHVLYVGKASNLRTRWQGHHRLDQLTRIHKKQPVRISWLDCSDRPQQLDDLEAEYIDLYTPLLNQTKVPAKKIIPAEVSLQRLLEKLTRYTLVFGIIPGDGKESPKVVLKYPAPFKGHAFRIRRMAKANNNKPTGLKLVEFIRRRDGSWWRASCNGVRLELGPWSAERFNLTDPGTELLQITLAGIGIGALTQARLEEQIKEAPFLADNNPGLIALDYDPIPLIWKGLQEKRR